MEERGDKLLDGEELLLHLEESFQGGEFTVEHHEIISESLGLDCAVELDPTSGQLSLLDAEFGIQLTAAQVLVLESFLSQYGKVFLPFAFAQVEVGA